MIKKFLIFAILLISQKLIICADECSVFSCSKLSPSETGQTCTYTGTSCKSKFSSCDELSETDCSDKEKVKLESPTQECEWITAEDAEDKVAKCQLKQLKCSDYIERDEVPPVKCESLEASTGNYCITDKTGKCFEESGCPKTKDTAECTKHKPLDSNHKWDHLRRCTIPTGKDECEAEIKLCGNFKDNGDDCTKLSTSDNTKKKCFLESGGSCVEQFVKCEYYTGDNADKSCETISDYIEDHDIYKCEFKDNTCTRGRKECSDFNDNQALCDNYTPKDSSKRCLHTTIGSETKCHELPKKCSDLNTLTDIKDKNHCEAIKEDSYSECAWETDKCVRKENKCESDDHNSPTNCNNIFIDNAHKCEYIDSKCVKVDYYTDCKLYTGKERKICEQITPPENNKRCILLNDKQCVSVPKECEDYKGNSEYECINNYKPLDENYKCVFTGGSCTGVLKQKEYCYQGDESKEICEAIIPKNNGENYSIKCKFEDSKCVRVEKPCEDYTAGGSEICSSIIPKDQNKKCILRNNQCVEEYKTCKAYNDDANAKEEDIDKETCISIISNDGKKCKYTAAVGGNKATCTSDTTNICDNTFIDTAVSLSSACASIKLSDISKKCHFDVENGECSSKSKACSELVFNGNEEGIENMCKSAKTSDDDKKKCIISSDKKRCLEVDKDLVIEDEPSGPGGNGNTNDSTNGNDSNQPEGNKGTEGDKGTEGTDESKANSGKAIYLNSLIGMILFLLL